MDRQVFYEVLVPLMEVKGTATICISTPLGSSNFYSELTRVQDDKGRPIFNVVQVGQSMRPEWKPLETYTTAKAIYGTNKAMMKRELDGEITDGEGTVFRKAMLDAWFNKPRMAPPASISHNCIYVALDPNGGANKSNTPGSDTAIVSFFITNGCFVICGLEAYPTADLYQPWTILNAHLDALRAVPRFANCRFRLIIECNLSGQGGPLCDNALNRLSDADIICSTNHTYGVFTVPGSKAIYFTKLRKLLAREALSFYENIVSACPYQASMSRNELSRANLEKFEHQIRSFRYVYPKATLTGVKHGIFTGHADHENHYSDRMQDDLVLAIGFGIKFALDYLSDPPFARLRTKHDRLY